MPTSKAIDSLIYHFSSKTDDDESVDAYDDSDYSTFREARSGKRSGACVDCKSVKVKCEFIPGERKCRRCQMKNLPCQPRGRKKRKPADTHEQLQEKARDQDLQIQSLLHKYDEKLTEQKRRGWMEKATFSPIANLSSPSSGVMNLDRSMNWSQRGISPESAVAAYFARGYGTSQLNPPDIVKYCELYPHEIEELVKIFFEKANPYFTILDEDLHTPKYLIWTCPFLFTVVCAVSSRYFTRRPEVHPLAIEFAREAAGKALTEGQRSVDVCQAYLIMAVYPVPKKKFSEDRSWLLMGVAIRMAMALELDQPPPKNCDERESLNRTRTWLNCYCVDGSHAIQFGKMPMLSLDDYVARNSRDWYKSSRLNTPFDVHLCAYVQIILVMAQWRRISDNVLHQKQSQGPDIVDLALQTQERLSQEWSLWVGPYSEQYMSNPLPICQYRGNTTQMITAYLQLVVLAVGFQHSLRRDLTRQSDIVKKSVDAGMTVIQIMLERLYPTGYLRYALGANFVYVSFAAAFLINLLRPRFLPLLDENQQREIIMLVTRLIKALGSDEVALDGRHTPALHSRFLSSLLDRHHIKAVITATSRAGSEEAYCSPSFGIERQETPPNVFHWPDIDNGAATGASRRLNDLSDGIPYPYPETEMDFSLTHFVHTVAWQDLPHRTYVINSHENWREQWDISSQPSSNWNQPSNFPELWKP